MKLSRRRLMTAGAALATLPLAIDHLLAANRRQAKIAEVRAYAVPKAVFVQVIADDGTSGWGEAGHSGARFVAKLAHEEIPKLVRGMDVFDAEAAWAKVYYEFDEYGPGGLASQALAGFDCALWDLRGKLLGVPVWALLGGRFRSSFGLYGSFSRATDDGLMPPAACARKAAELVGEGFKAVKIRLAIREENVDPDPDDALDAVRAVRRAIGDDVPLYVDANNGYSAARAIRVGRVLQDELGVSVFEEPVAAYHYASLAEVAAALDLDIAAGEHEYTRWQFRDLVAQGRADVLNPDVSKLGGLTEARHVASLAELHDLSISVHNARPTLLTAAHAHFVASCRLANRLQEHPGSVRLRELWKFFQNDLLPKDGVLTVPDLPGLGLVPDEAAIRAAGDD